jgi:hypothetical protein
MGSRVYAGEERERERRKVQLIDPNKGAKEERGYLWRLRVTSTGQDSVLTTVSGIELHSLLGNSKQSL